MKNKTLNKDTLRLIKNSKNRFFSLTAIVAIGVSFFVGLTSSSTMMADNIDAYDDAYNLKDLTVYSSYGFDEQDLKEIQKIDEVQTAELDKFADVYAAGVSQSLVVRVHSYKKDATINSFELVDGRLPQNDNEILVENDNLATTGFNIGSTIKLSRPDNDLDTYLSVTEVTVVGTVQTPLYLRRGKENSTLSNQVIATYFYIPYSAFSLEYDDEINIITKEGKSLNSFYQAYEDYNQSVADKIEDLGVTQATHMKDEVLDEAYAELEDGKQEYQDGVDEYNTSITDGQKKLDEAKQQIADGNAAIAEAQATLNQSQTDLDETTKQKKQEILDGLASIASKRAELTSQETDLNSQKDSLLEQKNQLETNISMMEADHNMHALLEKRSKLKVIYAQLGSMGAEGLDRKLSEFITDSSTRESVKTEFSLTDDSTVRDYMNAVKSALDALDALNDMKSYDQMIVGVDEIDANIGTIDGYLANISAGFYQLNESETEANAGLAQLDSAVTDGQNRIDSGWAEIEEQKNTLAQAQKDYEAGVAELATAKTDGQAELNDAKAKLDKSIQDINDLENNSWTVLTREQHYSSVNYKNSVEQMAAIANIFPVFFFMVAALVCLTTMTRMVDEERGQIGIYRALGYSRLQCMKKYIVYALIASIIGCIAGSIIGLMLFPAVIYNAWSLIFITPEFRLFSAWSQIAVASAAFIAVMMITTIYTAWKDMKEVPAQLLRPKSPKLGKSNFIEHITLIWSHISFTWKVTIRNLLRYKRRLIMTSIGVAGCTGLMIVGFGIQDSVDSMIKLQYDEIIHYDGTATVVKGTKQSEITSYIKELNQRDDVENVEEAAVYSGNAIKNGTEETVYAEIYDSNEALTQSYTIRTRKGHDTLTISDDGVVISEKMSEVMGLKVGDTFTLESSTGVKKEVKIAGICEMYIYHYVFMTQDYYTKTYGVSISYDTLQIKLNPDDYPGKTLQADLVKNDLVDTVSFNDVIREMQESIVSSLNLIIMVIILASMSLAFVVLGNLTNINISERVREIATLKVLGFYQKEVQSYIYKENYVLIVIGSLLGIPVGYYLHHWIMSEVEMSNIMYGRDIALKSYLISIGMTIVFGIIVNFFMRRKLKNIDMVESLKSVE